jgi:hypothetical protein
VPDSADIATFDDILGRLRGLAGADAILTGADAIPFFTDVYRRLETPLAVVRGMPFAPLFNTLGPKGERWVPLHGILPHSKVPPFHEALTALYAARAADMKRLGVWTGGMFATVNTSGFLYEIALYWPGARTEYHRAAVPADYLATLPTYADDPEVVLFVDTLKRDITALYSQFGTVHFQLGKTYPYAEVLDPGTLDLVRAIKASLDPEGFMNPGALGL